MSVASNIEYREAGPDDLAGVLSVQHDGFGRVALEFDIDPSELPPLREDLSELRRVMSEGTCFFVALDDGRVVGTVRGSLTPDGTVEIGRLAVSADHVRLGIGRGLIRTLERAYPSARRLELYTGRESHAPLALYRSLGYTEMPSKLDIPYLIWLEKPVAAPTATDGAPLHLSS
ncbi:MAG TPA: GNAT family N-acetyltransferase [Coriobacteriia bacterium]